jgi:hypothetical protein
MRKIDCRRELKELYAPSPKEVVMVNVPQMQFLMIDGIGDPNTSEEYQEAIEALFSVSYKVKFSVKKGKDAVDYAVMPLEGLWWVDDMGEFSIEDKSDWKWTAMIMQPGLVTEELIEAAVREVEKKKGLAALPRIRFETFEEGLSAQIMHIGPFSAEGPTIERIHNFVVESGHELRGRHHEIYLSDFRRAKPEKMRTIIRQPMK